MGAAKKRGRIDNMAFDEVWVLTVLQMRTNKAIEFHSSTCLDVDGSFRS